MTKTESFYADERIPSLPIDVAVSDVENPSSLVVLMPAYLTEGKERDDSHPIFTRFTWANKWPSSKVIAITDPAMKQHKDLRGAWYLHPDHDIIAHFAQLVREQAEIHTIPPEKILIYGSSLGGFGALAVASHIPGSRAVAEIPQIDFGNWIAGQVEPVEKLITGPIEDYRRQHPEQVSLYDRFRMTGHIPNYSIITNLTDFRFEEQFSFYRWTLESRLDKGTRREFLISSKSAGHRVVPPSESLRLLQP